jgi:hypothetical protein
MQKIIITKENNNVVSLNGLNGGTHYINQQVLYLKVRAYLTRVQIAKR